MEFQGNIGSQRKPPVFSVSADTSDNLSSHLLVACWLSVDKLLAGSLQTVTVSAQLTWRDDDWCCYMIDNRSRFGQK